MAENKAKDRLNAVAKELKRRAEVLQAKEPALLPPLATKRLLEADPDLRRRYENALRATGQASDPVQAGYGQQTYSDMRRTATERIGPRAIFVYGAFETDTQAWNELQEIVLRAQGPYFQGKGIDDVAREIDETEDTALTQWMNHWRSPPPWFRATAIAVMILWTFPTQPSFETPSPITVTPPLVDAVRIKRRSVKKILDATWQAHRDAYLDALYAEVDPHKQRFVHYRWAARYLVKGESAERIALEERVSSSAVDKEVEKIRESLGLPRRPRLKPGPRTKDK